MVIASKFWSKSKPHNRSPSVVNKSKKEWMNTGEGEREREQQILDQVFYCAGESALRLHYARSCKNPLGELIQFEAPYKSIIYCSFASTSVGR